MSTDSAAAGTTYRADRDAGREDCPVLPCVPYTAINADASAVVALAVGRPFQLSASRWNKATSDSQSEISGFSARMQSVLALVESRLSLRGIEIGKAEAVHEIGDLCLRTGASSSSRH